MQFDISPSSRFSGQIKVAGDKSISHRAIIFGSIARGQTTVKDILEGQDVMATLTAFQRMGVSIVRDPEVRSGSVYYIKGRGLDGLSQPNEPLDMGNSGTALRLLAGLLSAQPWPSTLTGDASLTQRPMERIIEPLGRMGACIISDNGCPPLQITPVTHLDAIHYDSPIASAQVKSAILLAGLFARGVTSVSEPGTTRDHTERMLEGFGYPVKKTGRTVSVQGGGHLQGQTIEVPADLSSAAFFIVGALISKNSEITLQRVGVNPSRSGVITILKRMGGDIHLANQTLAGGEPVADIVVKSSKLNGVEIAGDDIALAIDEIPCIAVAAACASGFTRICDAAELRVKESDRIASVVRGLQGLGVVVDEHQDGMTIDGGDLSGGTVDSYGDHRIAMAFAMAGAAAREQVRVMNCENVATSFPGFPELARQAGLNIAVQP